MNMLPRSHVMAEANRLVISWPDNPLITLDVGRLDGISEAADVSEQDSERQGVLVLTKGGVDVELFIADGRDAVRELVSLLRPHIRTNTHPEIPMLQVGTDAVELEGKYIRLGSSRFLVEDVHAYAQQGANVPLPQGIVQAGLLLLVVEAEK